MTRSDALLEDPATTAFRVARRAGRRRVAPVVVLWAFAGAFVPVAHALTDGFTDTGVAVVVASVIVLGLVIRGTVRAALSWALWRRAASGQPAKSLQGHVVPQQRTVSGREMRTAVVPEDGGARYLHLLFADDAAARALVAGPATVDLFAGGKVEGPARLAAADGTVRWAFTSKQGRPVAAGRLPGDRGGTVAADTTSLGTAGSHPGDRDRDPDRSGDGAGGGGNAASDGAGYGAAGDGWQGGSTWGSDSGWSGSGGTSSADGGGSSGGGDGGSSGGDSGGGGGGD
ncbi:hypothetical protein [Antribacter gilvus]|uniref:hypothetical protein n=1 Tax=Antribacter gilvus TaxID=2304675 RepID=UPI0013DFE657|nr:hypothetical protein [Antribacter gilvus]